MSSESDRRLRQLMQAAHAEAPAPTFDRLLARRPRETRERSVARWLPLVAAGALVVVIAVPLERAYREHQALAFAREIAAWRAPTDRLLEPLPEVAPLRGLSEPSILESI